MNNLQELIPFAKEMLSQKPSRGLLKVYLVGSVFAVLGTAIGLVETVCHPFCSDEPLDAEMLLMLVTMSDPAGELNRDPSAGQIMTHRSLQESGPGPI
uniref:G0/G1 switch 2 n=1 Tax=Labrus bergylta TaxID=56723 RepID=A0A3Q3FZ57_9LABR